MTRILSTTVVLPIGEHDDEVTAEVTGYVTLRGDLYDINISQVVFPDGRIERGAGLSARWAARCEDELIWAYERAEAAERRHQSIAESVRAVVGLGGGR